MSPVRNTLAAVTALVLIAGCGESADKAAQALAEQARQAANDDAGPDNQEIGLQTEYGLLPRAEGDDVALPDEFPEDIRLPDDYTLVSVMTMGPTLSLVMQSDRGVASLYEHFQSGQSGEGWTETLSVKGSGGWMLGFEKDRRGLLVNLSSDVDGKTVVSLSVRPR